MDKTQSLAFEATSQQREREEPTQAGTKERITHLQRWAKHHGYTCKKPLALPEWKVEREKHTEEVAEKEREIKEGFFTTWGWKPFRLEQAGMGEGRMRSRCRGRFEAGNIEFPASLVSLAWAQIPWLGCFGLCFVFLHYVRLIEIRQASRYVLTNHIWEQLWKAAVCIWAEKEFFQQPITAVNIEQFSFLFLTFFSFHHLCITTFFPSSYLFLLFF